MQAKFFARWSTTLLVYSVNRILFNNNNNDNLFCVCVCVCVCVCETWSLTLREEHMLRVFQNKMLRRIFVSNRDEVTGEWSKLRK